MTREEAIRQIENRWSIMDYGESEALGEALDMAIESLQSDAVPIQEVKLKDGFKIDDIDENYEPKIVGNAKFVRSKCEVTDLISRADAIEVVAQQWLFEASAVSPYVNDDDIGEYRQLAEELFDDVPSAEAVPQLKQTDTLIIADALRYLALDTERHLSDRTRADALREQILKYGASMCHSADSVSDAYKRGFDDCKRAYEIELARSSDAVQGEWTHDGSSWENRWVCNKCGHKIFERQTNFCPNCGARMKGGDDE